jgi:hypothetical protein
MNRNSFLEVIVAMFNESKKGGRFGGCNNKNILKNLNRIFFKIH